MRGGGNEFPRAFRLGLNQKTNKHTTMNQIEETTPAPAPESPTPESPAPDAPAPETGTAADAANE